MNEEEVVPEKKTAPADAEASTAQQRAEREGEAELVEEQMESEEEAEQRRQRQAEKASQLKSVPEGAMAPSEKSARGGETAYQRDYLLANARALTGHEPHVLIGALHGNASEYLTVKEAQKAADAWLDTEDMTEG